MCIGWRWTIAGALLTAAFALGGWLTRPPPPPRGDLPLAQLLDQDDAGFARADQPWEFHFPADHGPHPAFRAEVWSFKGHLAGPAGQRVGFQLDFLRLALTPQPPPGPSAWAANQVYRGYFSLTDVAGGRFFAFERFSRAALELSGAVSTPAQVWVESWRMTAETDGAGPLFRVQADQDNVAIELQLRAVKPVATGEGGWLETRGGLYAYLLPRLTAQGTVALDGRRLAVTGAAWLEQAWGRVNLSQGQLAVNRFTLQLDNGAELLLFQRRRRDGGGEPLTTGVLIDPAGATQRLERRAIALEPLGDWRSARSGVRYPVRWRLRLPDRGMELTLTPALAAQEVDLTARYWGGAVDIDGAAAGRPIAGRGYMELTGYEPRPDGR